MISSCIETVAIGSLGASYLMTRAKPVKESVTDAKIAADITRRFTSSEYRKEFKKVSYNVYQGRVLLTGFAQNKKFLNQAIKNIWKIKGVDELMNEVNLDEPKKRNIAFDHLLATQIKTRLFLNEKIKSLDINVEVYNKKVFLIGNLNNNSEIKIASKIAGRVKGVKEVTSYLRSI